MFDNFLRKKNRPRSIRVGAQRYFNNQAEPRDDPGQDALNKDEKVLRESSQLMRVRFRDIAQRIRIIRLHGIKKNARNINE